MLIDGSQNKGIKINNTHISLFHPVIKYSACNKYQLLFSMVSKLKDVAYILLTILIYGDYLKILPVDFLSGRRGLEICTN